MPGIFKQSFALVAVLISTPFTLFAGTTGANDDAASADPLTPSSVTPGRPHGQRNPHGNLSAEKQIQIALQHKMEGRPHEAIDTLSNALMRYDDNAQLYAVRGSLYLEQGKVTDALRDLESALKLNPTDASALTNRAQAYRGFGRVDEALADLDRAVELDSNLIAARFNRGAMRYEKGEIGKALADFNHCIAVDPHAPGPYFNRAAVYDAMSKRPEAVADLNRFMELTDNENWKKSAKEILEVWAEKDNAVRKPKDS